jgi:uncharacterized membrane-anchored protein
MDKQQTAVEWLINELHKTRDYQRVINEANQSSTSVRDVIEQAKEMEKERMIDFARKYMLYIHNEGIITIETFYNETYGGNK